MELETGIRPKKKFKKKGLGLTLQPDLVVSSGIPAIVLCVSWPCPYFGVLHIFIFVSEQALPGVRGPLLEMCLFSRKILLEPRIDRNGSNNTEGKIISTFGVKKTIT